MVSVFQVPQMNPDVSLAVSSLGSVHATTLPGCCLSVSMSLCVHALGLPTQKSVESLLV